MIGDMSREYIAVAEGMPNVKLHRFGVTEIDLQIRHLIQRYGA